MWAEASLCSLAQHGTPPATRPASACSSPGRWNQHTGGEPAGGDRKDREGQADFTVGATPQASRCPDSLSFCHATSWFLSPPGSGPSSEGSHRSRPSDLDSAQPHGQADAGVGAKFIYTQARDKGQGGPQPGPLPEMWLLFSQGHTRYTEKLRGCPRAASTCTAVSPLRSGDREKPLQRQRAARPPDTTGVCPAQAGMTRWSHISSREEKGYMHGLGLVSSPQVSPTRPNSVKPPTSAHRARGRV